MKRLKKIRLKSAEANIKTIKNNKLLVKLILRQEKHFKKLLSCVQKTNTYMISVQMHSSVSGLNPKSANPG